MDRPPTELWDVSADVVRLHGGHRNAVSRTSGLAADLVFKSSRRSLEASAWLVAVQDRAAASGLVVPRFVPSTGGKLLDAGWTCELFVSGRSLARHDLSRALPALKRFHLLTRGMAQRPGFLAAADLLEQPRGGDVDLSLMPEEVAAECRAAWRALGVMERSVVHGDVNPTNLIACDGGGLALIDWDEARADAPVFDIGQIRDPGRDGRRALIESVRLILKRSFNLSRWTASHFRAGVCRQQPDTR